MILIMNTANGNTYLSPIHRSRQVSGTDTPIITAGERTAAKFPTTVPTLPG